MEQFFVILAIAVFWLIRGGAQAKKRAGDRALDFEPFESGGTSPAALEESIETMELRAEQRAAEALRRWEARQHRRDDPKPVHIPREGEQKRLDLREALRSIAANLPVEQAELERERLPALRSPGAIRAAPATHVEVVDADPYALAESDRPRSEDVARAERRLAQRSNRLGGEDFDSALKRLDRLPRLQRAIAYTEIFGRPVALRDKSSG